jgi:hypothetical protein
MLYGPHHEDERKTQIGHRTPDYWQGFHGSFGYFGDRYTTVVAHSQWWSHLSERLVTKAYVRI